MWFSIVARRALVNRGVFKNRGADVQGGILWKRSSRFRGATSGRLPPILRGKHHRLQAKNAPPKTEASCIELKSKDLQEAGGSASLWQRPCISRVRESRGTDKEGAVGAK